MKKLNFAISFIIKPVILMSNLEVAEISINEEVLGYVHVNKTSTGFGVCTPFTHDGMLEETDCLSCAAKALFADRTSLTTNVIDIAEDAGGPSEPATQIKNMLLTAILKNSTRFN